MFGFDVACLDLLDVRVVERDVSLEVLDLGRGIGAQLLHGRGGELVRRAGRDLALLRLDADLDERVDGGSAALLAAAPLATACVEIPFLNAPALAWQRFATVLITACVVDDLPDGRGVRLRVLDQGSRRRRVRLAEIDRRGGRVDLAAAERDEVADHGSRHEARREQPPADAQQLDVAREVDFLLGLGIEAALRGSRRSHEGRR